MSARERGWGLRFGCVVALLAVVCGVWAAAAAAGDFARAGTPAGRVNAPQGVAVDQATGAVFVADRENHRVDEFEAGGGFVRAFGFGVIDGAEALEVCDSATGCREGNGGEAPGEITPVDIAVDGSGDVYVVDSERFRVEKFSVNGEFLLLFGKDVNKTKVKESEEGASVSEAEEDVCTAAEVTAHETCGRGVSGSGPGAFSQEEFPLSVDAAGDVWVGDSERVEEFSAAGVFIKEVALPLAGAVQSLAVEAEPKNGFYVKSSAIAGVEGAAGIEKFGPGGGAPVRVLDETGDPRSVAVDPVTGDVFVSDGERASARLLEYSSSGVQMEAFAAGEVIGTPEEDAVAFADKAQTVYTASREAGAEGVVQAFALPAAGPLVEPSGSTVAEEIGKAGARLASRVDPEGEATTFQFEYVDDARFKAEGGFAGPHVTITPVSGPVGEQFEIVPVSFVAGGLSPGTVYHFRVLAHNASGTVTEEALFETLPSARVVSSSVVEVTSSSATFEAQINPLGDATGYQFEYISEAGYLANGESFSGAAPAVTAPAAEVGIGSGEEAVEVAPQPIEGLEPHTTYRYRVVARNQHAGVPYVEDGPVGTFTTHAAGAFALPDGREWEMVSPPEKNGGLIEPIGEEGLIQAAGDGAAISYHADQPVEEVPGAMNEAQVLSTRGADGWSSRNIELPHASITGKPEGEGQQYRFFNEDLSTAVVQPAGAFEPVLSPEASEQTAFLRSDYFNENVLEPCLPVPPVYCYRPLVTSQKGYANVPAGTKFGENVVGTTVGACPFIEVFCGPHFVGASPDAEHVVFSSPFQLTTTKTPPELKELYEWSSGGLSLVSLLPDEAGPATGTVELGYQGLDVRHAVSDDGMRVFWSVQGGHLYMRDLLTGETLELDKVQGGSGGGGVGPVFQVAAGDGSRVFFTDTQQLTSDSAAEAGKPDLYECEIVTEAPSGRHACQLTDLTPETASGEPADVLGATIGVSENGCDVGSLDEGCYIYFAADGVLSGPGSAAVNGDCEEGASPAGATCNLYVSHDGATSLVAVLSGEDEPDWAESPGALPDLTARVSPDGRWLSFMSDRDLTGYDTRDARSGHADEEVYLYQAETGRLVCASCDPSGGRPEGVEAKTGGVNNIRLVGGNRVWEASVWLAANVPGWTPFQASRSQHQPRYLSDSGRLFFNSRDALVPRDVNGQWDVYEYEPEGVGPGGAVCGSGVGGGSEVFELAGVSVVEGRRVEGGGGCVGLISSGASAEESAFLDASESGGDAFFLTTAKLAPEDFDNAFDVYDAHECTAGSPCVTPSVEVPPACTTAEACRAAPTAQPPLFGAPSSATFSGAGNITPRSAVTRVVTRAEKLAGALKVCRTRDKRAKRRAACEAAARKRYGPVKKAKHAAKSSVARGKSGRR